MNKSLHLPTNSGWCVTWFTGETRDVTRRMSDGTKKVIKRIRSTDTYASPSKEKVYAKAEQMRQRGFEVEGVYECML